MANLGRAALALVCLVAGCTYGPVAPDPVLADLLVPEIEIEGMDGESVGLQRLLSDREYELDRSLVFAEGSFDTPSHRMFQSLMVFPSEAEAIVAFQEGYILGRIARTINRVDVDAVGANEGVQVCVDQVDYGAAFCDFPLVIVRSGRFLVAISGGREEDGLLLSDLVVPYLLDNVDAVCVQSHADWCL